MFISKSVLSLEWSAGDSDDEMTLKDKIPGKTTPEGEIEKSELKTELALALSYLDPREQEILMRKTGFIDLTTFKPESFEQIGNSLGLSKQRVQQIYKRAIEKLRANPKIETQLRPYYEDID